MVDVNYLQIDDLQLSIAEMESWIADVCSNEGKVLDELSLVFCSDNYLLEINQQHLNHDYYTDIITFDYSVDSVICGDLFISVDRVLENAGSFGVSFLHELHRVIIHGVLHLCGFNDKSSEEEAIMRSKEDCALLLMGFT